MALELRARDADVCILATHAHLMPEFGNTIREIEEAGFETALRVPAYGTAAQTMAMAASGFATALPGLELDVLVILGDRCEMLGVASAAMLCGVPIVHIAGGTVSEGAFDDSVRHAISKMATLHFPETELSAARLLQMGEMPENVITAGALGVENALRVPLFSRKELAESLGWNPGNRYFVVTLHAATLEEGNPLEMQGEMLLALAAMLREDAELKLLVTYPNADVDTEALIASLRRFEKDNPGRVLVVPSLGMKRYLSAVKLSSGVVGNSSSGLVEVPSTGVRTLDIGIRQQGRECGESVTHVPAEREAILRGLRDLLRKGGHSLPNPYEKSGTSALMATEILRRQWQSYPRKKFMSL